MPSDMPLHDSTNNLINTISSAFKKTYEFVTSSTKGATIDLFNVTGSGILNDRRIFEIINNFFGTNTATGRESLYLEEGYGRNPYVKMVVDKIAQVTSRLPRDVTGSNEMKTLYEMPNSEQNQQEFDEELTAYLEVTGDSFSIVQEALGFEGTGRGVQWVNIPPDRVVILLDRIGMIRGYEYEVIEGEKIFIEAKDVMHIKFSNIAGSRHNTLAESKRGMSPLRALWSTVSASNDVRDAWSAIHKNRGAIGFVTNKSEVPMLPDEQKRIQAQFNKTAGGAHNSNKAIVTNGNLAFVQMSMSPTDLRLLESDENNKRIISAGYGLDSSLFNDPENKTFANRKNADKSAYMDVYIPLAEKIDNMKVRFIAERFNQVIGIDLDVTEIEALKTDEQLTLEAEVELGVVRTSTVNTNPINTNTNTNNDT